MMTATTRANPQFAPLGLPVGFALQALSILAVTVVDAAYWVHIPSAEVDGSSAKTVSVLKVYCKTTGGCSQVMLQ
jgi:hypothetical protein